VTNEGDERRQLHRRVEAFIEASAKAEPTEESFDGLGLAIARYQAARAPVVGRLFASGRRDVRNMTSVCQLPAMPTDVFRLARIAGHPPSEDAVVFRTSGTTSGARGEHVLSTTTTYEKAALTWARWALFFDAPESLTAITLTPPRHEKVTDSSLHFMIHLFATELTDSPRFLQRSMDDLVDPRDLAEVCAAARRARNPVIVMGASFAFVHVLDALGAERLRLPEGSRVMHTGGFKGRSREIAQNELIANIANTFAIPESAVVGEYGMTELSSQLYEGTLRAARGLSTPSARHGMFVAPPWLRVVAVDAETLEPLSDGQIGILRFEDLANVDSVLAIQTADRGRCWGHVVELLGRLPGASPRGCSLSVEELMRIS
jgi:hypothetical protein